MLQNVRVTAFTVSELIRENQQRGGGGKITPTTQPPTQIRVDVMIINVHCEKYPKLCRKVYLSTKFPSTPGN